LRNIGINHKRFKGKFRKNNQKRDKPGKIAIDPAIGFHGLREKYKEHDKTSFINEVRKGFETSKVQWYARDFIILSNLNKIVEKFERPVVVGISRKSFLGIPTGLKTPDSRLSASLAAEAYAIIKGANVIRTHNVKQTKDVLKISEWIRETEEIMKSFYKNNL